MREPSPISGVSDEQAVINGLQLALFEAMQASLRPWLLLAQSGLNRIHQFVQATSDQPGEGVDGYQALSASELEEVRVLEERLMRFQEQLVARDSDRGRTE